MALDGVAVYAIAHELKEKLVGTRIDKISQPEKDELVLNIRGFGENFKLLFTANAQNPRVSLIDKNRVNPNTPPNFCMILRQRISNGKIIDITQPNFERVIRFEIQALNQFSEIATMFLVIEMMGKHSNIILMDADDKIVDSIKRVGYDKSQLRLVLPGRQYENPPNTKVNPLFVTYTEFKDLLTEEAVHNSLIQSFSGVSPILATELLHRADIDSDIYSKQLLQDETKCKALFKELESFFNEVKNKNFVNKVYYKNEVPFDFAVYDLTVYNNFETASFDCTTEVLEEFYVTKDLANRLKQKTYDIRKLVQNNIDRTLKKLELQEKTVRDAEKREKYQLYGELITANVYAIQRGDKTLVTQNYYSENLEEIEIKLDEKLTPAENAQKYFKKYNKMKRAYIATIDLLESSKAELEYLESIMASIIHLSDEADIDDIRQELYEQGFIKKQAKKTKSYAKSKPLHFISSDGLDIYVGKNNKQNDELTTKFATKTDIWLHAKNVPGSHVILQTEEPLENVPDNTLDEALHLAAFYAKTDDKTQVEVDYTPAKFVKKPNGAKPGMVIYTTNYSAYITPDKDILDRVKPV